MNIGEYTVGYSHTHPNNTAPSIDDVMKIINNGNTYVPASDQFDYRSEAFVSTVTPSGNYSVMIKDWDSLNGANNAASAWATSQTAINNTYQAALSSYLQNHGGGLGDPDVDAEIIGDASIYALKEALPFINIFKSEPNSRNIYHPVEKFKDSSNHDDTRTKNC
jgi:hypothetical protein